MKARVAINVEDRTSTALRRRSSSESDGEPPSCASRRNQLGSSRNSRWTATSATGSHCLRASVSPVAESVAEDGRVVLPEPVKHRSRADDARVGRQSGLVELASVEADRADEQL